MQFNLYNKTVPDKNQVMVIRVCSVTLTHYYTTNRCSWTKTSNLLVICNDINLNMDMSILPYVVRVEIIPREARSDQIYFT